MPIPELEKGLLHLFVRYSAKIFEHLYFNSLVAVRFWFFNAKEAKLSKGTLPFSEKYFFTDSQNIVFDEETSTEEFKEEPEHLKNRLITRIKHAFGIVM